VITISPESQSPSPESPVTTEKRYPLLRRTVSCMKSMK
jgi:hypothetical protein